MTSQMLMTAALIDTGVQYNAPAARTLLLYNAITTMVCLSSKPIGLPRVSFCVALGVLLFPVQTQEVSCPQD